jgi:hypothetical protein
MKQSMIAFFLFFWTATIIHQFTHKLDALVVTQTHQLANKKERAVAFTNCHNYDANHLLQMWYTGHRKILCPQGNCCTNGAACGSLVALPTSDM